MGLDLLQKSTLPRHHQGIGTKKLLDALQLPAATVLTLPWDETALWVVTQGVKENDPATVVLGLQACGDHDLQVAASHHFRSAYFLQKEEAEILCRDPQTLTRMGHLVMSASPEAAAILAQHPDREVSRRYLREVTDLDVLHEILPRHYRTLSGTRFSLEQITGLWERGTPVRYVYDLLRQIAVGNLQGPLRDALIQEGHVLPGMELTSNEVEALLSQHHLAESDRTMVAHRVLAQAVTLTDSQRVRVISWLSTHAQEVRLTHADQHPYQDGDLARLAEMGIEFTEYALQRSFRAPGANPGTWRDEYLRNVPAPWSKGLGSIGQKYVAQELQNALGDDIEKWDTVLSLMASWTGTLQELIEATEVL